MKSICINSIFFSQIAFKNWWAQKKWNKNSIVKENRQHWKIIWKYNGLIKCIISYELPGATVLRFERLFFWFCCVFLLFAIFTYPFLIPFEYDQFLFSVPPAGDFERSSFISSDRWRFFVTCQKLHAFRYPLNDVFL